MPVRSGSGADYNPSAAARKRNLGGDRGWTTKSPAYKPGGSVYNQQVPKKAGGGAQSIPFKKAPTPKVSTTNGTKANTRSTQQMLKAAGFNPGPIDGIWGPQTQKAYDAWKANGSKPKGAGTTAGTAAKPAGSTGGGGGGLAPSGAPAVASSTTAPPKYSPQQIQQNTSDLLKQFGLTANQQVSAQLDPQINAIQRQLELLDAQYKRQQGELSQRKGIATGDLTALFDRTRNYLGNLQNTQDQQYGQGAVDVSQLYNQLRGATTQNFSNADAATNAEAARLGLEGGQNAAVAQGNSDEAWLNSMANTNQGNALSTLTAMRQGFDNLMAFQRGNMEQEKSTRISQSQRDYDKQLNELMNMLNDQTYNLQGERRDVESGRAAKIQEIMDALLDKLKAEQSAAEQSAFERWLAEQGLALDQQKFQFESQYNYDQLNADLLKSQLAAQNSGSTAAPKPPTYQGSAGAYSYMKNAGLSSNAQGIFNDYIGSAYAGGGGDLNYTPPGYKTTLAQELQRHAQRRGVSNAELAIIMDAIKIAGGKKY